MSKWRYSFGSSFSDKCFLVGKNLIILHFCGVCNNGKKEWKGQQVQLIENCAIQTRGLYNLREGYIFISNDHDSETDGKAAIRKLACHATISSHPYPFREDDLVDRAIDCEDELVACLP